MSRMKKFRINKSITDRTDTVLDSYLNDLAKIKLISTDKEIELALLIKSGDKKALETLIKANLRFVISVSKQYQNQGLDLTDLISEGNIGLIRAANSFDETRGFRFVSYAVWYIRQAIIDALQENSRIVRLPINQLSTISNINKAVHHLEQMLERDPTTEEIANILDIDEDSIKKIIEFSGKYVSMDDPLDSNDSEDKGVTIISNLKSEEEIDIETKINKDSLSFEINSSMEQLNLKEKLVINMYYGLNGNKKSSLDNISKSLKLSKERTRHIREKAVRKLQHYSRSNNLKEFL